MDRIKQAKNEEYGLKSDKNQQTLCFFSAFYTPLFAFNVLSTMRNKVRFTTE